MNYEKELTFAKDLALKAGEIMQRYFQSKDIGTEWKDDDTPLTVADTAINNLVIKKVQENFPEHGVIGEEASFEPKRDYVWVVDPIDGTIPFSLGMPFSTFSLALVDRSDGQSVLGVAYDPYLHNLFHAVKGDGAFLNNTAIHVSDATTLHRSYISVLGNFEKNDGPFFYLGKCADILRDQGAKSLNLLSQVYIASRVANGELVGSIFAYGSPWDSAAVSLLVTEAGGIVTDLEGKQRRYDEFANGCVLAPNETILKIFLDAIQESTS